MSDTSVDIPSPCYVLESTKLIRNLKILADVQEKAGVEIILAFKGFAMWKTFPLITKYLKGAAASSLNEAKLCNDKMGRQSHTYAVAYADDEFDRIAAYSSHLTFNSLNQFETFKTRIPNHLSIGLRVNPEWSDVTTDLYNPANPNSRLGMTKNEFPDDLPEKIEGFHFHTLCESSAESLVTVLDHFMKKFDKYIPSLKWINMGGGHGITSKDYNSDLLIKTLINFKEKYNVEVILEPGSAIAWQTGYLKSTVLDIVTNNKLKTAILDISISCHMSDCLEMPYRPTIQGANTDASNNLFQYRLGGVSCLAGDYLEAYGFDQELMIGDSVIFEDMMHYTMVKTTSFNGVKHPSIGIIDEKGVFDLIREFGYFDYLGKLS